MCKEQDFFDIDEANSLDGISESDFLPSKVEGSENEFSNEFLAYLAGFCDGNGSIIATICRMPDYKVIQFHLRITISFTQKSSRSHFLEKIQKKLRGKGSVRNRKDGIHELALLGPDARWLIQFLQPYLSLKKKQANLALKILEQLPSAKKDPHRFLELCKLADQIAALNDSKTRATTSETVRSNFLVLKLINE